MLYVASQGKDENIELKMCGLASSECVLLLYQEGAEKSQLKALPVWPHGVCHLAVSSQQSLNLEPWHNSPWSLRQNWTEKKSSLPFFRLGCPPARPDQAMPGSFSYVLIMS